MIRTSFKEYQPCMCTAPHRWLKQSRKKTKPKTRHFLHKRTTKQEKQFHYMVTFEEAFEKTGHGIFNYVIVATCGLVLMYTNIESLGTGYILAAAECDLGLSGAEKGMINSAAFIGIMSTAIFWGYLSDRYGRRAVMLPATTLASFVSFGSSFSMNFWTLFLLRCLTGCLVSASSATVYAYLGEMHSDSRRSAAIAFGSAFISLTFIILPILAWIILPGKWSVPFLNVTVVPWRVFMWSWCLPGLTAALILLFLPESPRYLYVQHGQEKAVRVLAKIYAYNTGKKREDYPIKSITRMSEGIVQKGFWRVFQNIWLLLRPPLLRCVLISHLLMSMVFMLSSGLYTWMPVIINDMLYNVERPVHMCHVMIEKQKTTGEKEKPGVCEQTHHHHLLYPVSIAMGVLCATIFLSIGFLVRKFNKIHIYCMILVVCCVALLLSSLVPQLVVALVLLLIGLSLGCAASVLAAIAIEVFPTNVRALALCTLYMAGRLGAAVGANLLGLFLRNSCVQVMLGNTILTAASTLLMFFWPDPMALRVVMKGKGFVY